MPIKITGMCLPQLGFEWIFSNTNRERHAYGHAESHWRADCEFDEVFDAAKLTSALPKDMHWDNNHFRAPIYNHLNSALLHQLYG